MTNNHNYATPNAGAQNWGVPLNENFKRLDRDVEIRDKAAARSEYNPKDNAKFLATDTGTTYLGDGDSWIPLSTESGGSGVPTDVYASSFDGDGLASKVQNALDTMPGQQARIRVAPRADGSHWTWDDDISLNPKTAAAGIHIDIADTVKIEYPGDGWAITADTGGEFAKDDPAPFTLRGGQWYATGNPKGFCRLVDIGKCIVDPYSVVFEGGSNRPVRGIQVKNTARWCEMNKLLPSGGTIMADVCLDFLGASYNPDASGGTDSFQGTYVGPCTLDCDVTAIRMQGNMQYSLFDNPQMFLFGDGATGMELNADTRMWGLTVTGGKTEEHASNTSSFHFGPDFDGFYNTPTLVGGFYEHPTQMVTADSGAQNPYIFNAVALKNGYEIRCYSPEGIGAATFGRDGDGVSLSVKNLEVETITDASSGTTLTVDDLVDG